MSITSIGRNFNHGQNIVYIICDDDLDTLTTEGFLELPAIVEDIANLQNGEFQWEDIDRAFIWYGVNSFGIFQYDPDNQAFKAEMTSGGLQTYTPTITFATPGNLTVSYAVQIGQFVTQGNVRFVKVQLTFTPTHTTASGLFRINLPEVHPVVISLGGTIDNTGSTLSFAAAPGHTMLSPDAIVGQTYATIVAMGHEVATTPFSTVNFPTGQPRTINTCFIYTV